MRIPNVFHALNRSSDLAGNWDLLKDHLPDSVYHFDEPWTLLDWASDSHKLEFIDYYGDKRCQDHGPLLNLMAFLIFELGHQPGYNFNHSNTIDHDKKTITTTAYHWDSDGGEIESASDIKTSYRPTLFESRPKPESDNNANEQKLETQATSPDCNTAFENMTHS